MGRLGAVLGGPGGVLGPSWGVPGRSWGRLGGSWGSLGRSGNKFRRVKAKMLILDNPLKFWPHIRPPGRVPEGSQGSPGGLPGPLGSVLGVSWESLGRLGVPGRLPKPPGSRQNAPGRLPGIPRDPPGPPVGPGPPARARPKRPSEIATQTWAKPKNGRTAVRLQGIWTKPSGIESPQSAAHFWGGPGAVGGQIG